MQVEIAEMKRMLGSRIRALRASKGLTQQELAELCSLNYKYLGGIERGERNPTFENLVKISQGLGISLHSLFILEHESHNIGEIKAKAYNLLESADEPEARKAFRILAALLE